VKRQFIVMLLYLDLPITIDQEKPKKNSVEDRTLEKPKKFIMLLHKIRHTRADRFISGNGILEMLLVSSKG
jgi:hypothetical protein